jgi:acyl-CoA reductase-like NAD-dependent aldehyde dehydrogenase
MTTDKRALLDGEWRVSADDGWLEVVDPADLRGVVPRVPALTAGDISRAYDGAEVSAKACAAVNDSAFGPSASLRTRDLAAANLFLDRAQTGKVAISLPTSRGDMHHPFGGFRDSGSPFKEQGLEALQFYSRVKTYAVKYV